MRASVWVLIDVLINLLMLRIANPLGRVAKVIYVVSSVNNIQVRNSL